MLATVLLVFAVDRSAKAVVFRRGAAVEPRFACGPLAIRPVRNERPGLWPKGSAFAWIASLALAFAAAALLLAIQPAESAWLAIGLGAALGGALGNLYDRVCHGAVLDFLHVGVGGRFNPADVALVAGLVAAIASQLVLATSLGPGTGS